MKKFVALLVVSVFCMAAPMVFAQSTAKTTKKEPKLVKCCIKGECKDLTKKECHKEKGHVVKDCAKCKK